MNPYIYLGIGMVVVAIGVYIAYRKGWISREKMLTLAQPMLKNQYGRYLLKVVEELDRNLTPNL